MSLATDLRETASAVERVEERLSELLFCARVLVERCAAAGIIFPEAPEVEPGTHISPAGALRQLKACLQAQTQASRAADPIASDFYWARGAQRGWGGVR